MKVVLTSDTTCFPEPDGRRTGKVRGNEQVNTVLIYNPGQTTVPDQTRKVVLPLLEKGIEEYILG